MEFIISSLGAFMMTSRVKFVGSVRHSPISSENLRSSSAFGSSPISSR